MDFIEAEHKAWHAFRRENEHGAAPEVLARINNELNEHEDAAKRHQREALAGKIGRTDTTYAPGAYAGSTSVTVDREAREYAGAFWTWARHGLGGRSDPLQALGFGSDAEVKWTETR